MRFFAALFVLAGMVSILFGARMAAEGLEARSWPTAPGRIVISKVTELRTSGNIRVARLCVELDYLYMVDGRVLEGRRLNAGWRCFASEDRVKEIMARYPVGKEVAVYYDPQRPERSMLEPGLDWTAFMLLGVGVINLSVAWPLVRRVRRWPAITRISR